MHLHFTGEIWYWRGPSPFHFVTVPVNERELLASIAPSVTYGWGMIPVRMRIGATQTTTSLWPKDGGYIVPIKSLLRAAENVGVGDRVTVDIEAGAEPPGVSRLSVGRPGRAGRTAHLTPGRLER